MTLPVQTLKCRTVARGRFSQINYIRDLPPQHVMENEQGERADGGLGDLTAPNALEALLAAFGSCLALGIHANAVAQHITVRLLELDIEADFDSTATWGSSNFMPKTIGLEMIRVSVHLDADAPREQLAALVEHAALWSPVANTLYNPVHLDVSLADSGDESTSKANERA